MKKTPAFALSAVLSAGTSVYLTYRVQALTAQVVNDPVLEGRSMGIAKSADFFSGYSPGMIMLFAAGFVIGTWMLFFLFTRTDS